MTEEYKPKYRWTETWPGEGHKDYIGLDGGDTVGRLQLVIGGKMGGKWLWAAGHAKWIRNRITPHTGYTHTAREGARKIEEYHDRMKSTHGR